MFAISLVFPEVAILTPVAQEILGRGYPPSLGISRVAHFERRPPARYLEYQDKGPPSPYIPRNWGIRNPLPKAHRASGAPFTSKTVSSMAPGTLFSQLEIQWVSWMIT